VVNRSKQKGTQAETAVVNALLEKGFAAKRNPPMGAADRGDIDMSPLAVVVEVKNQKRTLLSEWLKEAEAEKKNAGADIGVVWHKKIGTTDPMKWYVTMTGEDFCKLLEPLKL
jgi:hypothetical protein